MTENKPNPKPTAKPVRVPRKPNTLKMGPLLIVNMPRGTRWPNMHEWAFAIFSFLTWKILEMIRENPALLAVPSFMQFTQTLATGGVLAAAAWLWSSNKAKQDLDSASADQPHGDVNMPVEGDVNIRKS